MVEAIAEFLFKTVGQFLLEVVFYSLFYWPGWLILRVLTLGKYPPVSSQPHNRYFVSGIPLVLLLIGVTFYYS